MGQPQRDCLLSRWLSLLSLFGVPATDAQASFEELADAYAGAARFYHNLDHIRAVLATIDGLADLAGDLPAVQLAAWYHDVIYDSRARDNEERSAEFAGARCSGWGVPVSTVGTVRRLILATKRHHANADDVDAHILLDADLAILGADEEEYARYARAIREEYAWVAEDDYRRGRASVLHSFLGRARIFRLERMHEHLDAAARRNVRDEIAVLGA
jgi:predicted metal-dependent HD superfamily phosphohydrolase